MVGSRITELALPTVAILMLRATPLQVGFLAAMEFLPYPVLSLVAGVIADRLPRARIMIACDFGRMVALSSIPAAFLLHALSLLQLYIVALVAGTLTVFFEVAYRSFLPVLLPPTDLVEGNSKLEASNAGSQLGGPALAGFLIQAIGAAQTIAADSASYLVSLLAILGLSRVERSGLREGTRERRTIREEIGEGVSAVWHNVPVRRITAATATSNLGLAMSDTLFLLFVYRSVHLGPGTAGVILSVASVGSGAGALLAGAVSRRVGVGWSLETAVILAAVSWVALPLALVAAAPFVLGLARLMMGAAVSLYRINAFSLWQAMTPSRLQGRVNATIRTVTYGMTPVGTILGGLIGNQFGLLSGILAGAAITFLASTWIANPGILRLRLDRENRDVI